MAGHGDGWARGIGLLLGLSLALAAAVTWRIPGGTGTLGADLVLSSGPTGELGVSPAGPFVSATGLRPGPEADAPSGTIRVSNQTGTTLGIRMRGLPSGQDLDRLLWVRIDADGSELFRGPVGDLRSWTERAFTLASGERTTISVRTWLPPQVSSGYEGRIETVDLEFRSTPTGAGP